METVELRIRHIPAEVARAAKAAAALAALTLNDWIIAAMEAALKPKRAKR